MMTLIEVCEPLFVYICRLNRSARKGGGSGFEFSHVRSDIESILKTAGATAAGDPRLSEQFRLVELPLLFFVDSMIAESKLPFTADWNKRRLAFERNELAGDEKFFDLLDETLADPSEQATERLQIFYTCIGLGFSGWYAGQRDYLRRKMLEMSARMPDLVGARADKRICIEAYEHLDTRDLIEPPAKKLVGIAIVLAGLVVMLMIANIFLFKWTSEDLMRLLKGITAHEQVVEQNVVIEEVQP